MNAETEIRTLEASPNVIEAGRTFFRLEQPITEARDLVAMLVEIFEHPEPGLTEEAARGVFITLGIVSKHLQAIGDELERRILEPSSGTQARRTFGRRQR